ncbi:MULTISPECIES: hypothetical protein [Sphingobacterium]|uniref:hypothetical protein n=2 Tax=Sphingobacterium TaxID=28453 RepID=UPI0008A1D319|nr:MULTISPECIES: hypothetical protein [Sphingobacterium]HAF37181.1 hypothetical protein [Sphingobacterium sp.]OFV15902.1 hypothetical protein HMPREF3127_11055 [Sphingobacterium sp. HMSC13C05]OJZ12327.1 MAG: hypothetical protein BGP15_21355 [Sphingobacterium sp. 40-24]HAL53130.1 hypothetical protein [Sphingobacterium sp.]HAT92330.1 hypothetical protein [Sphingobacterium sp.]
MEGLFYCSPVADYTLFVYSCSAHPQIACIGSYMTLEKVDWWNRGGAQNRRNAVGIKGGLPELKEAYWNGKRPIEIAKGLFSKLN